MKDQFLDWQVTKEGIKDRGKYLLENGTWGDCQFIVGTKPYQEVFKSHKVFLAMSSPVFEAMFYGGMPETNPITVIDVQPDVFKIILEYIYTDEINLTSFEQARELYYAARKYMLQHLLKKCTEYLCSNLNPRYACKAYELAKLFEDSILIEKSFYLIREKTRDVISNTCFHDVELSTILTILDQDQLNIDSELELFTVITKYSKSCSHNSGNQSPNKISNLREALKKIRFLTLTSQQFVTAPAITNLLSKSEKLAILMKISSPKSKVQLPLGFSTSRKPRSNNYHSYDQYTDKCNSIYYNM